MSHLEPVLDQLIDQLIEDEKQIPESRRSVLDTLTDHIHRKMKTGEPVRLHFICTHNSRRSQMAQIWAHTAAKAYQVPKIETFSGGTEATAFHPNAVRAFKTLGFRVTLKTDQPDTGNPRYEVGIGNGLPALTCYSKKIEEAVSPDSPFVAVMTCSDADQNCPVVPGAEARIPLTYEDPKRFDGSDAEQKEYLKTAIDIGRELVRVFRRV